MRILALCSVLVFCLQTQAKLEFTSSQLLMKTSDQVNELVRKKIQAAAKIQASAKTDEVEPVVQSGVVDHLRDGMRIVLCRPDQDGTRSPAFARLRRELTDLNEFERVLSELGDEAIGSLRNNKEAANRQATYVVLLENLMAEMKPEVTSNQSIKKLIEKIRDADLQVSDQLKSQQFLRTMSHPVSPSATAAQILPKPKPKSK